MSEATHGGKGSRPRKVDKEKFESNWDAIFGKKSYPQKKWIQDSSQVKKMIQNESVFTSKG